MGDYADVLLEELDNSDTWPLPREKHVLERVAQRRALRQGDKQILKQLANWDTRSERLFVGKGAREYIADPLPRRIAAGFADFLFGEDPEIRAAAEGDQAWHDQIAEVNELPSELHTAEQVCVSEGETWWKIYVDRDVAPAPLIQFASRLATVPLLRGGRLLACAFVTVVACEGEGDAEVVWRHVEAHARGRAVNRLYRGTPSWLGVRAGLDVRPELAGLPDEWPHGLEMLAGRILNERGGHDLGVSDYDQVQDLLLALNEARTIGAENTRLTAKKRVFMAGSVIAPDQDGDPSAPVDDDVIIVEADGGALGEGGKPPITEVEYSYDAAPLIAHTRELEATILSRVGLVPQFVGAQVDGQAESGTAIRLRFLPTINTAKGKARAWDDQLPRILTLAALVDQLPEEQGGYGRDYQAAAEQPAVVRPEPIPTDETETTVNAAAATTAEIQSRRTSVRQLHPDWTDEQVSEELALIAGDIEAGLPPAPAADQHPPAA